jgi:hypothetical protein
MSTEENAARRRMDGAHLWRIPGAGHYDQQQPARRLDAFQ